MHGAVQMTCAAERYSPERQHSGGLWLGLSERQQQVSRPILSFSRGVSYTVLNSLGEEKGGEVAFIV